MLSLVVDGWLSCDGFTVREDIAKDKTEPTKHSFTVELSPAIKDPPPKTTTPTTTTTTVNYETPDGLGSTTKR